MTVRPAVSKMWSKYASAALLMDERRARKKAWTVSCDWEFSQFVYICNTLKQVSQKLWMFRLWRHCDWKLSLLILQQQFTKITNQYRITRQNVKSWPSWVIMNLSHLQSQLFWVDFEAVGINFDNLRSSSFQVIADNWMSFISLNFLASSRLSLQFTLFSVDREVN